MSQAELVVGREALAPHEEDLSSLLSDVAAPATARWRPMRTWLDHNPDQTPCAVLVRRKSELVAALLMVRRTRRTVRRYQLMGEPRVPDCVPVRDAAAATELADSVIAYLDADRHPWLLTMAGLADDDQGALAIARRLARSNGPVTSRLAFGSARVTLDPGERHNGHGPHNPLSRNTRAAVAKARNRITKAGLDFAMTWTHDPHDIVAAVPDLVALYHRRNQQNNQNPALLEDPAYRSYFTDMLCAYALDGHASLLTVRLNDELASYAMCLRSNDVQFVYSNRMSPEWMHYSPGTIANAEVVGAANRDPGLRAVDWGAGIQRYKLSGNAVVHPYRQLDAASGRLVAAASSGVRRVRSLVG